MIDATPQTAQTAEPPGEWAPIPGWPHEASRHGGRIRTAAGRVLAQRPSNRPLRPGPKYQLVNLCAGGRKKTATVHTLVLLAHRPHRDAAGNVIGDGRPPGMVARHGDDVPDHNDLDNLSWGTPPENEHDKPAAVRARAARQARAAQGPSRVPEIAGDLAARIEAGEFAFAAVLPAAGDLAAEYGTSGWTVARALELLGDRGIAVTVRSNGASGVRTDVQRERRGWWRHPRRRHGA